MTKYFLLYLEPPELFLAIFLSQEHFALLSGYLGGCLYMLGLEVKHLVEVSLEALGLSARTVCGQSPLMVRINFPSKKD